MRRLYAVVVAILAAAFMAAPIAYAQDDSPRLLLWNYDLDGAAADDDILVASANLADSTTYVIASQPDTPRPIVLNPTDANDSITAGTVTVTGLDSAGTVITLVKTFTGGVGTGSLAVTSTTNFASITSVISSVLTGEQGGGVDLVRLGTTATLPYLYCLYENKGRDVLRPVVTVGSSTTVTAVTAASGPFLGVAVGDWISFSVAGVMYDRRVTTWTSADEVVVNTAIDLTLPATGTRFRVYKRSCGTTDTAGWARVATLSQKSFAVKFNSITTTTGVDYRVECKQASPVGVIVPTHGPYTVTLTTSVYANVALGLVLPWDYCRVGWKMTSTDDAADAGIESIDASFEGGE